MPGCMQNLLRSGIKPTSPALAGGFLTTRSPGNSGRLLRTSGRSTSARTVSHDSSYKGAWKGDDSSFATRQNGVVVGFGVGNPQYLPQGPFLGPTGW